MMHLGCLLLGPGSAKQYTGVRYIIIHVCVCVCACIYMYIHFTISLYYFSSDLTNYGWYTENDTLHILWDSPENQKQVQTTVDFLTQAVDVRQGAVHVTAGVLSRIVNVDPVASA